MSDSASTQGDGGTSPGGCNGSVSRRGSVKRKPVPVPRYDSNMTLRDGIDVDIRLSTPATNPLEKTTVQIVPERLGEKAPHAVPSPVPRTRIVLPRRNTDRPIQWKSLLSLWTLDLVWFGISLGCLIIIFAVLSAFDGKKLTELPMNITLNAFLAWFTTWSKAAFMLPLSEAISQWKWNWYNKDRSLADFQVFDEASRGALGSIMLLRKLKHTHIASIGAVVGFLGLLTSPITQLSIEYPQRLVPSETGQALVTGAKTLPRLENGTVAPPEYQTAITSGVLAPWGDRIEPLAPLCSSTACSFPEFDSLAVCTRINNITSHLTVATGLNGGPKSNETGQTEHSKNARAVSYSSATLSGTNCTILAAAPYTVRACKTPGSTTISFAGDEGLRKSAIYSMPIMYSVPGDNPRFEAVEVLFHMCVNSYEVKVADGKSQTVVKASSNVISPTSPDRQVDVNCTLTPDEAEDADSTCVRSSSIPSDAFMILERQHGGGAQAERMTAHFDTLERIAVSMNHAISGFWVSNVTDSENITGFAGVRSISKAISFDNDPSGQTERVRAMMENIAVSLTNVIRATRGGPATGEPDANTFDVSGVALTSEVFIRIRWGAFTLIILQFAAATGFLVATAILTQQMKGEVLKSSALAVLFALEDECRAVAGGLESVAGMKRKARVLQVRLRGDSLVLSGMTPQRHGSTAPEEQPPADESAKKEEMI